MNYPEDALFDIETLINVAQPTRILLLGDQPRDFLDNYIEQKTVLNQLCTVTRLTSAEIDSLTGIQQRFDVGVIIGLLEHIDKKQGALTLSRLRDVLCPQYCLCLPISDTSEPDTWQLTDLFGFALRRVALYEHQGREFGLFKYHIDEYKKTPDWLNPDNWANPEMWGKYWW